MKADRRTLRVLVLLATIIAVSAAWYLLLYSPQRTKVSALNGQLNALNGQVSSLQGQVTGLQLQKKDIVSLKTNLAKVTSALPSTPQLSQFLTNLEAAASAAGVSEVTVNPTAPASVTQVVPGVPAGLTSLPVTFSVDGHYSELLSFLHKLEGLPRLVLVKSVSLGNKSTAATASASTGPLLSAQIQASIFETQ